MHACFSGNNKMIKEITKNMKVMSLNRKVGSEQRRRGEELAEEGSAKKKIVPAQQEEEEEQEEERGEWIAEPEPGVLMTLVSRPNGTNHLKKIRFREQLFDAWAAQTWWAHNYHTILELYTIAQSTPVTPCQSEDDVGTESSNCSGGPSSGCGSADTLGSPILGLVTAAAPQIHPYEPAVLVTRKELRRVPLRDRFAQVKSRVWWEDNKATLQHLYSSSPTFY